MNRPLTVPLMLLVFLSSAAAAWPAYERRNEALQLYQEGLFQETGTGDLGAAQTLYRTLTEHYSDYRDIASVAWYHLGLVYEKQGRRQEAQVCFQTVSARYPDQALVLQQARQKLNVANKPAPTPSPTVPPATPQAVPEVPPAHIAAPASTPVAAPTPAPLPPTPWGVGVHYGGVHVQGRVSEQLWLEAEYHAVNPTRAFGLRALFPLDKKGTSSQSVTFLGGLEIDMLLENTPTVGYRVGGFAGVEWRPWSRLGVEADLGYFYVNTRSTRPGSIRNDPGVHIGTTYYF